MKHLSLVASVAGAALLAVSCMKKPDMENEDGEVATPEAVQEAVIGAWGTASPMDITSSEFSYTEKTIAVADLPSRVVFQDAKTVQSVEDSAEERTYVLLQQVAEIGDNNEQKLSTSERRIRVGKGSQKMTDGGTVAIASGTTALPISIELASQLLYACVKGEGWDVSCYNLKTWESEEPVPPQVASQTNCAGVPNCRWKQKNISFDLVVAETKDGVKSRTKARYAIKMSPDAPYLSRVTEFCYEGLAGNQNGRFRALICQKVRNFRR